MDPEGGQGNHADHKPKSEARGQVPQVPTDGEGVTLTARLIRSFAHRNLRHLVLRGINLDLSGDEFLRLCREEASRPQSGLPPPFRTFGYDCCKIEHQAHGSKTSDPCINREEDDRLILKNDVTLREAGVKNETEISVFCRADYEDYKNDPALKW